MSLTISAADPSLYVASAAVLASAASPSPASPATAPASNPMDTVSLSATAVAQQSGVTPTQFSSASDAAGAASQAVSALKMVLDGLGMDRDTLQPDRIADIRKSFGDKATNSLIASTENDLKANEGQVAGWSSYLQTNFQVTGSLVNTDKAGTETLGSFSLSYQGSGFAMKGSSTGSFQVTDANGAWKTWSAQASNATGNATPSAASSEAAIALMTLKSVNRTV